MRRGWGERWAERVQAAWEGVRWPSAYGVVSVAVAFVLGLGMAMAAERAVARVLLHPRFAAVEHVAVVGQERTSEDEVLRAASLDRPRNVWSLDEAEMAAAVQELLYVHHARVRVDRLSRTVVIDVEEAAPVAIAVHEGRPVLVNAEGERMGPWTERESDLPWLLGYQGDTGAHERPLTRRGIELLREAHARGFVEGRRVREVHRLPTGAARVVLADDVEVRLADDQLDRRWERLLDVYAHAGRQGRALRHVVLDGPDLDRITVAFRDPEATP